MPVLRSHGATDVGRKRQLNEDAFLCDDEIGLYVVCDGMGGHAAGEVASSEAVDVIYSYIKREVRVVMDAAWSPHDLDKVLAARRVHEQAIKAATYHLKALAEAEGLRQSMGTTTSVLQIAGPLALVAWVGDSRIYRVRNGVAEQLTEDHSVVAQQLKAGVLTPEQAAASAHKNLITRAVGSHDYVQVDTASFDACTGDTYLVCTDGLHGYLAPAEVPMLLVAPVQICAERLTALANARGGKDNITAVVVRIEP